MRFEYHVKWKPEDDSDCPAFQEACEKFIPGLLPVGLVLEIFRWTNRYNGKKLHPRFVLTEKGGIGFEQGLDTGHPGEETLVTLLDAKETFPKTWAEYQYPSSEFDLKEKIRIEWDKGKPVFSITSFDNNA